MPRGALRGSPQLRLRMGFLVIAMVLSVFGARLVQLQGVDPNAYAAMAAAEGTEILDLPARRGDILDRNGKPLAHSVEARMVVANPQVTAAKAPELARFLSNRLDIDYFVTLKALRLKDKQFAYIARRVPASKAEEVVAEAEAAKFKGLDTRRDPLRDYPNGDIAANLVGFVGIDEALAGFERNFDDLLAGRDGSERYAVGDGKRIPLGEATIERPVDGQDLQTTIDADLQFYAQRVLRQTVEDARADSGFAVVMDSETGEVLALPDFPTFDARNPQASAANDRVSRAMTDVYEPGSVQKVLTLSALIDAGLATSRTRVTVPPDLVSGDRLIHDWFDHGTLHLTLAGVIAQSSNIGTVLASRKFESGQLRDYLTRFGLGRRTDVGVPDETQGILPDPSIWTAMTQDRIAFGQSLSVNALQMAAAVNTIANDGVRVSPSLVRGTAVTDGGITVGTDTATTERVISRNAARQTARMMERVVDPDAGVAPAAQIPGYRVAGKTGTAQRVGPVCGCYNGTFTVSFAGFAPADKPRFTVYVVVQNPRNGGGGGSVAGPAFAKIMSYALRRYGVPPTGSAPSRLPTTWRPGQVASR
jgi:cell division protein FtsI (penicillin-binding protein 3)